jgi:hypothetical protein
MKNSSIEWESYLKVAQLLDFENIRLVHWWKNEND